MVSQQRKEPCAISHVLWRGYRNELWSVEAETGEPVVLVSEDDTAEADSWFCGNCGREWEYVYGENTWIEITAHIEAQHGARGRQ
jgi:hypothetical protein